ncbi:hypothetical protein H1R20_g10020, partial [Candolleomyces eurysporus]
MGNEPRKSGRQTKKAKARHGSPTSALDAKVVSNGKQQRLSFDFFEESPLDILGEVLSYLSPLDLLRLARTTKALRAFLMSKSSSAIWKSSLAAIEGLPPCPEDLSEPQYANLMCWDHCHVCFLEDGSLFRYMEARVQLCSMCGVNEFQPWDELPESVDKRLKNLVPSIGENLSKHERQIGYVLCDSFERTSKRKRVTPPAYFFHVAIAVELNKEIKALRSEKLRKAWVDCRGTAWRKIKEHSDACRKYKSQLIENEGERVCKARDRRREQLRDKLAELGWEHEFDTMGIANSKVRNAELCYFGYLQRTEELSKQGYHHTAIVLDLLGLERTTTAEELRKFDPYLECLCGCFKERKSETMSWMQVLQYCKRHRSNSYEGSFAIVDKPGAGTLQQVTKYKPICSWCQPRNLQDDPTQDSTQHYIEEHRCTQAEAQAFDSRALKEELVD